MRYIVTGGSGFIGSCLIKRLLNDANALRPHIKILSIDNYLSGSKKNEVEDNRVKYIEDTTWNINKYSYFKPEIVFHFGEYSRISQSFEEPLKVFDSNLKGTYEVIEFCKKNNCKLMYSGSSSTFGDNQNMSPYSWSKAKNVELIKNYGKWYKLKYTICYFYNVYGNGQITSGKYSTVIGIFEDKYKNNKPLTVVYPGTQKRDFTHIDDTINGIILSTFNGDGDGYFIRTGKQYSIIEVAKMFNHEFKIIGFRKGDRIESSGNNKKIIAIGWEPCIKLEEYIETLIKKTSDA